MCVRFISSFEIHFNESWHQRSFYRLLNAGSPMRRCTLGKKGRKILCYSQAGHSHWEKAMHNLLKREMFDHIKLNNITANQKNCYPMNFNGRLASVIRSYQGHNVKSAGVRTGACNKLGGALRDEPINLTHSSKERPPSRSERDNEQRPGQCLLVDFPSGSKRRNVHADSEDESSISTISGASGGNDVQSDSIAMLVNAFGFRTVRRTMQKEKGSYPLSKQSHLAEARTSNQGTPATMAPNFPTIVIVEEKARRLRR